MTIEIDNRLYENIVQWCNANGVEPKAYIEKALRERIATDKYGDLNERLRKNESEQTTESAQATNGQVMSHNEDAKDETTFTNEEQPVVKKKRTLKTK